MPGARHASRASRQQRLIALSLCAALSTPMTAWAQAPTTADLSSILECKAGLASYFKFRRWISRGGADVARAGFAWRKTDLFQAEYGLSHRVAVFGMQARTLGLTDNGVLADVDGATPQRLAQQLGVDPLLSNGATFVANKLVAANKVARSHAGQIQVAPTGVDALLGITPTQPAYDAQETIQVVTNLGRAGKTLVGCNYISSAESPNLPFPVK